MRLPSHQSTFPQTQPSAGKRVLRYLITIPIVIALIYAKVWLKDRRLGHHATKDEVVGTWVHHSGEVNLELHLLPDGHFDRLPKFMDFSSGVSGTDIPEAGTWLINNNGVLVLAAATVANGSFYPYIDGENLNLAAESDKRVTFRFTRKK